MQLHHRMNYFLPRTPSGAVLYVHDISGYLNRDNNQINKISNACCHNPECINNCYNKGYTDRLKVPWFGRPLVQMVERGPSADTLFGGSLAFILGGASVYAHSTPVTETMISDTVITKY